MSSSEKDLVQASLQEVKKRLHVTMPLRHFSEHQDEDSVRKVAQQIGDEVFWNHLMRKVKTSNKCMNTTRELVDAFCTEMKKLVEEYVNKNQDFRTEAQSFLEKKMESITDDFKTSLEAKFLMNPDMDLKLAEEFLEDGKLSAMSYFERMWKHGNVGMYEECKIKLEQKLDELKKEMFEKQSRHLHNKADEDARISLNEVKEIVLEMSRRIKNELKGQVKHPKEIVKEGVHNIHDYLNGKGKILNEMHSQLVGNLKDAIKSQDNKVKDMSVEDATRWAEELHLKLQSQFVEFDKDATRKDKGQQENGVAQPLASHFNEVEEESRESSLKQMEASALTTACMPNKPDDLAAPQIVNVFEDGGDVESERTREQSDSMETSEIVNGNDILEVGVKRGHVEDLEVVKDVSQPVTKMLKEMPSDSSKQETGSMYQSEVNLNVPDRDGKLPLLRALEEGQSVARIKKMLDDGANVNVTTNDDLKYNAAHQVIRSLINEKQNSQGALDILGLLVANGFNLINEGSSEGVTPLFLAMEYDDLNEHLLNWFHMYGTDFNATENYRQHSVLFQAIEEQQSLGIIQKILDFGGNPKHVGINKWNVLHQSARYAHESALKIFIDRFDVNECTVDGFTPLHLLFQEDDLDYHQCLEMLVEKKADFEVKDTHLGYVPLASWIKFGKGNFFAALIKLKDQLSITPGIASDSLTAIVEEIERLQTFLPSVSQDASNEFVEFILLLIEEKRGTLRLEDESNGNGELGDWGEQKNFALTTEFCKELETHGDLKLEGQLIQIKSTNLGKLDIHTESGKIGTVPIEIFLQCLLCCNNYSAFVNMCQRLKEFCSSVSPEK